VDEVFSDYGRSNDIVKGSAGGAARVGTAAGNHAALTFTMNGFSKLVGLPQVKMGWIHVSGPVPLAGQARERLAFVTDAFLSVSAAIQHAAATIFRQRTSIQEQISSRLEENGRTLEAHLSGIPGVNVLGREGGWYAIVRVADDVSDDDVAVDLLEDEGVLVHPGYFFDFPRESYLIVSLLPSLETFREGVSRILTHIDRRMNPA